MRKSFTRLFGLMVLLTSFISFQGYAGEAQETVELYAGSTSACYSQSNDYAVAISVKDFIQLDSLDLHLTFNDAVFNYTGTSGLSSSLTGATISESSGDIHIAWNGSATTIGNDVKTDIVVLHFSVVGFPNNTASSFSSDLEWGAASTFWYDDGTAQNLVNTITKTDGSLAVTAAAASTITTAVAAESCAGGDATVSVTAPVGSGTMYLFNEDPDPDNWVWSNSPDYQAAAGETVTVRVKDASGCVSLKKTINIPETVDPVSFSVATQDPQCAGEKGSVIITAAGGTSPYTYYINSSASLTGATVKNNFQFSMSPGIYFVAVQDANGCANLADANYWKTDTIFDNNTPVVAAAIATDAMCNGGKGSITVDASGGVGATTADYMFSIDGGSTWKTATDIGDMDLSAGTYTVWAKDPNGCTDDTTGVVIGQPDPITFDIAVADISCGDSIDGKITVSNLSGGTPPYTIAIEEGSNVTTYNTVTTDTTFAGLMPTYYSLTVTDASGCSADYANPNGTGNVIAVQSPEDINFTTTTTNPSCNNEDATIALGTITGGSGSYVVSFDDGTTWVSPSSTYTWVSPYDPVTVSVANAADTSCVVSQPATAVDNPDALVASIDNVFPPTCEDGTDGNIFLNISGGTTPYMYSVNNGAWKSTSDNMVTILAMVGTYQIMVKDANGCTVTELDTTVTIEPNTITASSDTVINCYGQKEGTISVDFVSWATESGDSTSTYLDGTGNVPERAVSYWVENGDGTVSSFVPSNHAGSDDPTLFNAGTYYVWVTDQYTCMSNVDTVVVKQNPELVITDVTSNGASCFGTASGTITVYAKGGTLASGDKLQYAVVNDESSLDNIQESKWKDFDTEPDEDGISTVSFQVDGGTYYIAVRDNSVCESQKTYGPIVVEGYKELLVDEGDISTSEPTCNGDADATLNVPMSAVSGGAGAYMFTLLDSEGDTIEGYVKQSSGNFTGLVAGTYFVKVEDSENCPSYTTGSFAIDQPDPLTFTVDSLYMSCADSNDGLITVDAYGGTADYSYAINNQSTWFPFGSGEHEKKYLATEPGTFKIWVKDDHGCVAGPKTVTILAPTEIEPSVVSTTNVSCNGDNNGAITVTATGGWDASIYEYRVDDGSVVDWTTSTTLSGLSAGTHTLWVRDVNSYSGAYQQLDCTYSTDFEITEPAKITYEVTLSDVKCKGGNDGTFTVHVTSGGTPWFSDDENDANDGYQVQLTGSAYNSGSKMTGVDNTYTFTGLAPAIYTLHITDANGCTLDASSGDSENPYTTVESWEIQEPDTALTIDAEWVKDADCYNTATGQFKINAHGGVAPYKYYAGLSIQPDGHILVPTPPSSSSDWKDSNVFNVKAGTWVVWVMDANGCMVGGEGDPTPVNEWRVAIDQPDSIQWAFHMMGSDPDTIHYLAPSCNGSWDGAIHIVVSSLTGGSGTYNATVTGMSADGVAVDTTYTDIQPDATLTSLYVLKGIPASDANGFTVSVTDDNACTSVDKKVVIKQPAPVMVSLQKGAEDFTCPDAVQGQIEANAVGGTAPYEYQLLKDGVIHTPYQDLASTFLVQVGHKYTVMVKDAHGCVAEDSIDIKPVQPVEFTVSDVTCYGETNASAKISATGEAGRTFSVIYQLNNGDWSDPVALDASGEAVLTGLTYANVTEGLNFYHFQVLDSKGCESEVDTASFVPVQTELMVNTSIEGSVLTLTDLTGGTAPYTLMIGDSVIGEVMAGDTYDGLMVGDTVTATIADAHGCTTSMDVVGTDIEAPVPVSYSPVSGATLEDNYPAFVVVFNEDIQYAAAGNLYITKVGGTQPKLTIPITADMVNGDSIKVPNTYYDPEIGGLNGNTEYSVTFDAGVVADMAGNTSAGLTDHTAWTFTTGVWATGVKDLSSLEFKVYPNPFDGYVTVQNADKLSKIIITNVAGQRVRVIVSPKATIQTSDLRSGVYFMTLITKGDVVAKTERIVKR